jgi:hypothetical protein
VPEWLPVYLAAQDWRVPPWVIEDDCNQEWWDRHRAYREELAAYNKKKAQDAKTDSLTTQTD